MYIYTYVCVFVCVCINIIFMNTHTNRLAVWQSGTQCGKEKILCTQTENGFCVKYCEYTHLHKIPYISFLQGFYI